MTPKDSLLAAMVITIWGVNFMFLKFVLQDLSPMVLGMLRFALVVFPALLWLKRPPVAWRWLVLYGITISFGQFGLMFAALSLGLPTGLTALILQAQVFITVALAALLWREPIRANHLLGMLTAAAGLLLIGIGQHQGSVPMAALWAILGAAVSWALGNVVVKYVGKVNALSVVVWGDVSSLLLFALASFALYGGGGVWQQISGLSLRGLFGVLFVAYAASLIGYAAWGSLLSRYPAGKITPLALLVPVVALLVAWALLNEYLNIWHWLGVVLVMAALLIHVFGGKIAFKRA